MPSPKQKRFPVSEIAILNERYKRMSDTEEEQREITRLCRSVDLFSHAMKAILAAKARAGRRGWDDPDCELGIATSLLEHAARKPNIGQEVDIANLAMMLWFRRGCGIVAAENRLEAKD